MRILIVAIPDSVHTARWISQLTGQGWDLHLFPSLDYGYVHPEIAGVTLHQGVFAKRDGIDSSVRIRGIRTFSGAGASALRHAMRRYRPSFHLERLCSTIRRVRPDVVHSIEIQAAGYLTLDAKHRLGRFPPWIVTNWGSDLFLFGRLAEHVERVRAVLAGCDFYSCECERDVGLARQMGLQGEVLPVFPNTGGFDLPHARRLRQPGPPSARRTVLLKGYQNWAGRALVGLRALALCADLLREYRIAIFLASPEVRIAAELAAQETGLRIELVPKLPHEEMLRLYGQARISIGLGISDAISTSLLEAMVMGAFPIQSRTACADEWIVDGETGAIVPPEDPGVVAASIRRALMDDDLVNTAAIRNATVADQRLAAEILRPKAVAMYERAASQSRPESPTG